MNTNIPKQLKIIPNIMKYQAWGFLYFFIRDGKVIYVGKTKSGIGSRIGDFKRVKDARYDSIHFTVLPIDELDKMEQCYIKTFRPRFNITHKK